MTTPLVLRKFDGFDDWYTIERRDHDGREWTEPTRYGSRFMASRRIIPHSCVEGTMGHMISLAAAIERRDAHEEKRCAVDASRGDAVAFWSPRNSNGDEGIVTLADADDLAHQIRTAAVGAT